MALTKDTKNTINGVEYPAFKGSPGQCKWARSIRFTVITGKLYTEPDILALFKRINDATWWIANKASLFAGDGFKQPSDKQLVSATEPELPSNLVRFSVVSARVFAHDAAQHPKLAELAILVMMARGTTNLKLRAGLKEAAQVQFGESEKELVSQYQTSLVTIRTLLNQL